MAKLERPVDLDLNKVYRNRVSRLGIELEGGWRQLPPNTRLHRDGSVNVDDPAPLAIGELPSPHLLPSDMPAWMRKYYPHVVNHTCGMHVHMAFGTALMYQRLMDPRFPATVIFYMARWAAEQDLPEDHPIWPRLRGDNIYCKHQFFADAQARMQDKDFNQTRDGNRYTFINYCFSRYGTAECRGLPMMNTVDQAISAIQQLLTITNAFLVATRKREEKFSAQIMAPDDTLIEEHIIRL